MYLSYNNNKFRLDFLCNGNKDVWTYDVTRKVDLGVMQGCQLTHEKNCLYILMTNFFWPLSISEFAYMLLNLVYCKTLALYHSIYMNEQLSSDLYILREIYSIMSTINLLFNELKHEIM